MTLVSDILIKTVPQKQYHKDKTSFLLLIFGDETYPMTRPKLILIDLCIFFLALIATLLIRYPFNLGEQLSQHLPSFLVLFFFYLLIFYSFELYEPLYFRFDREFLTAAFSALLFNFFASLVYFYIGRPLGLPISPYSNLVIFFIIFTILFFLSRRWAFAQTQASQKIIFIGQDNQLFKEIASFIKSNPHLGLTVEIAKKLPTEAPEFLIINGEIKNFPELPFSFNQLKTSFTNFFSLEEFYTYLFKKIPLEFLETKKILEMVLKKPPFHYLVLKRLLDIFVALLLLPLFVILLPFIALSIKISDPKGPVFIRQQRLGQFGKVFTVYKFRTMRGVPRSGNEFDQNRIFPFGKFLRTSHLDELPQIFNILKGELSFVGPRGELVAVVEDIAKKVPYYRLKLLVQPGLTGWAQLMSGYAATIDDYREKISYDLYYLANRNLIFDLIILLKTLKEITLRKGE